jgi:hypothetical protein
MESSFKKLVEFFIGGLEVKVARLLVLEHVVGLDLLLSAKGCLNLHEKIINKMEANTQKLYACL